MKKLKFTEKHLHATLYTLTFVQVKTFNSYVEVSGYLGLSKFEVKCLSSYRQQTSLTFLYLPIIRQFYMHTNICSRKKKVKWMSNAHSW